MAKATGVISKRVPKIEDVFELALNYEVATLTLTQICNQRIAAIPPGGTGYTPENRPRIVLSAFSLELYFKCLLLIDTGKWPKRTHNLRELFRMLPSARQKRIKELHAIEFDRAPYKAELLKSAKGNRAAYSVANELRHSASAFEEWRYAFDGVPTSRGYAGQLIRIATRRTILEVRPDLRAISDQNKIG